MATSESDYISLESTSNHSNSTSTGLSELELSHSTTEDLQGNVEKNGNMGKHYSPRYVACFIFISFICGLIIASILASFVAILYRLSKIESTILGERRAKGNRESVDSEIHHIGWVSNQSIGILPSKNDLNSLEFSHPRDEVHFFSMDGDFGVEYSFYRVNIHVGRVSCDEIKSILGIYAELDSNSELEGKFECSGVCWCESGDYSSRRSTTIMVRSASIVVAAASSIAAVQLAREKYFDRCAEYNSDTCPSSSVRSELDECHEISGEELKSRTHDLYHVLCAFFSTHDVLSYNLHAKNEEEARKIGLGNAVEEIKNFVHVSKWEWLDYLTPDHAAIDRLERMEEKLDKLLENFVTQKRVPLRRRKIDCCGKCKFSKDEVLSVLAVQCCEFPMENNKAYEHLFSEDSDISYVDDLVDYSIPSLLEICVEESPGSPLFEKRVSPREVEEEAKKTKVEETECSISGKKAGEYRLCKLD